MVEYQTSTHNQSFQVKLWCNPLIQIHISTPRAHHTHGLLQGDGGFGAQYQNTTHAKVGDLGSKLAPTAPGATWKAGDVVEVAWTLQANHGGGYSYRLCPADEPLTEACFQV